METIILTQPSLNGFTLSQCLPILSVIATQQGLNLNNVRQFNIAKRLMLMSIAHN